MKSVTSGHILCEFMQTTPAYASEIMCCFGDGVKKVPESAVSASPQRYWLFVRPQEIK